VGPQRGAPRALAPPEGAPRGPWIEARSLDLARPPGSAQDGGAERVGDGQDRRLAARRHVERSGRRRASGREEGGHGVVHVHVVARLAAVAEHGDRLAGGDGALEERDDARLAVRILARPVDVGHAQGERREAVVAGVEGQVGLGRRLSGAVRRDRRHRLRLARRYHGRIPVHRRRRREQETLHAGPAGRLEHRHRAGHVHARVRRRLGHRPPHVDLGGEVAEQLRPDRREKLAHRRLVRDVRRVQLRSPLQRALEVLEPPCREVVDRVHGGALGQQSVDDMGADEAGSACDDGLHESSGSGSC
jgi:hypothetical protein